jgi:hypothetical protein
MDNVECHSGSSYTDKPLAFTWQGERYLIADILSQGRTPEAKWFRVRTNDGELFTLSYDEKSDTWQIQNL